MVNLLNLISKFRVVDDRENDVAFFRTHTPWVAPEAYLNIIFKPANPAALSNVIARMMIPVPYIQFLQSHNGAILLSNTISLYGVVHEAQILKRSDPFSLPPFNIEKENRSCPPPDRKRFLKIGGYGFDGSLVCMDRENFNIHIFRKGMQKPYQSWRNLEDWLNHELHRLSECFDSSGRQLVDEAQMFPMSDN